MHLPRLRPPRPHRSDTPRRPPPPQPPGPPRTGAQPERPPVRPDPLPLPPLLRDRTQGRSREPPPRVAQGSPTGEPSHTGGRPGEPDRAPGWTPPSTIPTPEGPHRTPRSPPPWARGHPKPLRVAQEDRLEAPRVPLPIFQKMSEIPPITGR
ncbi:hypothetical protein EF294_03420 [Gordonia oryzae]|uniref:Uncharacterized protein n=1 Tax=Gordonia oryzae TaxID=2487349 RepID=A0A3N4GS48_9ACTN|nr:hypothetical protein EF294_03420 [Gordonia oryzae]